VKTPTKLIIAALALGSVAWLALAQDDNAPPPRRQRPPREDGSGPGGPGGPMQRPMLGPLWAALDVNHDGVIDEKEIEHAAEALKKLDKNGDGKITPDEVRPPRPEGARGPGGPGFDRGPGGPPPGGGPVPPRERPQRPERPNPPTE